MQHSLECCGCCHWMVRHFFLAVMTCNYYQLTYCTYTWCISAVNCGTLPDPVNGKVSHTAGTTFGKKATYNCNRGYNLVGDSIHTCQATGVWSGSAPTCKRMLLCSVLGQTFGGDCMQLGNPYTPWTCTNVQGTHSYSPIDESTQ